jgi:hypothetical protein
LHFFNLVSFGFSVGNGFLFFYIWCFNFLHHSWGPLMLIYFVHHCLWDQHWQFAMCTFASINQMFCVLSFCLHFVVLLVSHWCNLASLHYYILWQRDFTNLICYLNYFLREIFNCSFELLLCDLQFSFVYVFVPCLLSMNQVQRTFVTMVFQVMLLRQIVCLKWHQFNLLISKLWIWITQFIYTLMVQRYFLFFSQSFENFQSPFKILKIMLLFSQIFMILLCLSMLRTRCFYFRQPLCWSS